MQKTRDKSRKPARTKPKSKEQPSLLEEAFDEGAETLPVSATAEVASAEELSYIEDAPVEGANLSEADLADLSDAVHSSEGASTEDSVTTPRTTTVDLHRDGDNDSGASENVAIQTPPVVPTPEPTIIGEIFHPGTGLVIAITENPGKRTAYTASTLGIDFRNSKREKLEQQIHNQLDRVAALEWTPIIEAYTRYVEATNAYLSMDRYWVLALPAGDILRANWRVEQDDAQERFRRAFLANCPPGFGPPYPFMERSPHRQRVWMAYTESVWNTLQQSLQKLRAAASNGGESATLSTRPSVYVPKLIPRYELHYVVLEQLIREHLQIDYSILAGERWNPDGANVLEISLDGYDDSDRSVIEQVREGDRTAYALEILMRVLVEKHVLPEGPYLITARPE